MIQPQTTGGCEIVFPRPHTRTDDLHFHDIQVEALKYIMSAETYWSLPSDVEVSDFSSYELYAIIFFDSIWNRTRSRRFRILACRKIREEGGIILFANNGYIFKTLEPIL